MSELKEIDANSLYSILLRETENDSVQEINQELYILISNFVGKLKSEGYDGVEAKVKDALVNMITELTTLLLKIRLEKALKSNIIDYSNLLNEEKFILDAEEEKHERLDIILSSTLNGKSKFLDSVATKHKTKLTVVRFLKETEQMVGADLEKYGPFKAEDVATIPYENAQALISKKIATKIRWED
jgi:DNA replication factor GINS